MQIGEDGRVGHLTYCTNIHAAEHFDDVLEGLAAHLPRIKAKVSPEQPLGVGLRLAASASRSLLEPANLERLQPGDAVNLERSVNASTRLSGHIVRGVVETTCTLDSFTPEGEAIIARDLVEPE